MVEPKCGGIWPMPATSKELANARRTPAAKGRGSRSAVQPRPDTAWPSKWLTAISGRPRARGDRLARRQPPPSPRQPDARAGGGRDAAGVRRAPGRRFLHRLGDHAGRPLPRGPRAAISGTTRAIGPGTRRSGWRRWRTAPRPHRPCAQAHDRGPRSRRGWSRHQGRSGQARLGRSSVAGLIAAPVAGEGGSRRPSPVSNDQRAARCQNLQSPYRRAALAISP